MVCFSKFFDKTGQILAEQKSQEFADPLEEELWKAKEDWDNAYNFFNQVADPDLVDYAIFELQAAERRYVHLLKIIKKEQGYYRDYDYNEEIENETNEEASEVINEGINELTNEVITDVYEEREEREAVEKMQETRELEEEICSEEDGTKELIEEKDREGEER